MFKVILLEKKCVLTILELNWNQGLGQEKTKLNICHHILTSRTSSKCQKMRNARAKRSKLLFFTVKHANLWGFCCRRRRGCLSSLLLSAYRPCSTIIFPHSTNQINFSYSKYKKDDDLSLISLSTLKPSCPFVRNNNSLCEKKSRRKDFIIRLMRRFSKMAKKTKFARLR